MYDIFNLAPIKFPAEFLWGSSTAAHQIEGNNIHSNYWAKEQKGGIWSQWDIDEPSGLACNHWELFREDVKLLAQLGHKVYRMSIEWSRIEPVEGKWNQEAVQHYVELLSLLRENGIRPMVTLHHFTHPQWFEEKGEFNQAGNLPLFFRYVERLVPEIKDYVYSWNIFNEFNRGGYYGSPRKLIMLRAHAHVYRYLKSVCSATVSSAHALSHFFPYRHYDKFDNIMCQFLGPYNQRVLLSRHPHGRIRLPGYGCCLCAGAKGRPGLLGDQFLYAGDGRFPQGELPGRRLCA